MNKKKWVTLMSDIGLDDKTMTKFHREFEAQHSDDHQVFLEWLNISADEIVKIRSI